MNFTYEKAEITHLNYNEYDQKHSSKFLIGVPGESEKSTTIKYKYIIILYEYT